MCRSSGVSAPPASVTLPLSRAQPVLTAALAWALYGEAVTATFVVGGAMVVAGVVLTERG